MGGGEEGVGGVESNRFASSAITRNERGNLTRKRMWDTAIIDNKNIHDLNGVNANTVAKTIISAIHLRASTFLLQQSSLGLKWRRLLFTSTDLSAFVSCTNRNGDECEHILFVGETELRDEVSRIRLGLPWCRSIYYYYFNYRACDASDCRFTHQLTRLYYIFNPTFTPRGTVGCWYRWTYESDAQDLVAKDKWAMCQGPADELISKSPLNLKWVSKWNWLITSWVTSAR